MDQSFDIIDLGTASEETKGGFLVLDEGEDQLI